MCAEFPQNLTLTSTFLAPPLQLDRVKTKQFDPFTGTFIIPQEKKSQNKKSLELNYSPALNAYVKGDALSGLRSQKRHQRILEAKSFLDETKLDDETREERQKMERKRRADEEYMRAKQAVHERKVLRKKMTEKLATLATYDHGLGKRRRPGGSRSRHLSSNSSVSSYGSITTASSVANVTSADVTTVERDRSVPDVLVLESSSFHRDTHNEDDEAALDEWEGKRVKTPIWSHLGRGTSAGHTPFAASAEKFSGWMKELRQFVTSRGGRETPVTSSTSNDSAEKTEGDAAPPVHFVVGGAKSSDMSQTTKSRRPLGRRRYVLVGTLADFVIFAHVFFSSNETSCCLQEP